MKVSRSAPDLTRLHTAPANLTDNFCILADESTFRQRGRREVAEHKLPYVQSSSELYRLYHMALQVELFGTQYHGECLWHGGSRRGAGHKNRAPQDDRLKAFAPPPPESPVKSRKRFNAQTVNLDPQEEERRQHNAALLGKCKFFDQMRSLDATTLPKLAKVAKAMSLPAGHVLYRQGNKAGSAYVVVKGRVGVHRKTPLELRNEYREEQMLDIKRKDPSARKKTLEGHGTFVPDSFYGEQIATIGTGRIFGERVLVGEVLRENTIVCTENTDVLLVTREDFEQAMPADVICEEFQKMELLNNHVEVFKEVPSSIDVHPSFYFTSQSFSEGEHLLTENKLERRVVFVVRQGCVCFHRAKWSKKDSETVTEGGMFSSVGAVPFHAREPFSAIAASPSCEVLVLEGDDLRMLPEVYLDRLRTYLRQQMLRRLKQLCVRRTAQRDPAWFSDEKGFAAFTAIPKKGQTRTE